jgi:hypothetical protein
LELPASDADDRELLLTHKNTNLTAVNEKDEQNSDGINSKKSPQREKEQLPVPEGLEPIHKYNRVFSRFYGLSERIV